MRRDWGGCFYTITNNKKGCKSLVPAPATFFYRLNLFKRVNKITRVA